MTIFIQETRLNKVYKLLSAASLAICKVLEQNAHDRGLSENSNVFSDSFTILGLWVLGLAVSYINESNCKLMSPEHYFLMTSLQYYCILGLAEKKTTLHPRDKIMRKRCRMRR